ncbi:hypothetical protein BpHYR1_009611 [Brachionus plicatilis]|uniref:Uncharacterized protein n=1 Tax=Brachionus plicatilis TaxID=10195 RepID=A0A3M7T677_BRAPC|nr:hypothetical protein BpHYR1_009611 [Brachionus plicatilis]
MLILVKSIKKIVKNKNKIKLKNNGFRSIARTCASAAVNSRLNNNLITSNEVKKSRITKCQNEEIKKKKICSSYTNQDLKDAINDARPENSYYNCSIG